MKFKPLKIIRKNKKRIMSGFILLAMLALIATSFLPFLLR